MLKDKIKKYRALIVIALGMIFNLISSLLVYKPNGVKFNLQPLTVTEWICDIISFLTIIYGCMMATYDMWKYKPKKKTTYITENGEITKIIIEE